MVASKYLLLAASTGPYAAAQQQPQLHSHHLQRSRRRLVGPFLPARPDAAVRRWKPRRRCCPPNPAPAATGSSAAASSNASRFTPRRQRCHRPPTYMLGCTLRKLLSAGPPGSQGDGQQPSANNRRLDDSSGASARDIGVPAALDDLVSFLIGNVPHWRQWRGWERIAAQA